jgi:hypothetical protein
MSQHQAGRRPVFSGLWYDNSLGAEPSVPRTNSATIPSGFAIYVPFIAPRDFTVAALGLIVFVGVAASTVRPALYTDTGTCAPGLLLVDGGDLASATSGLKSVAVSQPLVGGELYWLASQVSNAALQMQVPPASGTPFLGLVNAVDAGTIKRAYNALTYGAFPAAAPAVSRDSTMTAPSVLIQAA